MTGDPKIPNPGNHASPTEPPVPVGLRSLARRPDLVVAATYHRRVTGSLDAVWENVFDWEHLPWLHASSFSSIELVTEGDWGWHARILPARGGGGEFELELVADRPNRRYVARTLTGAGAGAEIWTRLEPEPEPDPGSGAQRDPAQEPGRVGSVSVAIEFHVPPLPEQARRALGRGYVALYTQLWNEDEEMIGGRAAALRRRRDRKAGALSATDAVCDLGSDAELRARLPFDFVLGGERFRVVDRANELAVDALECPHRFGPLVACADSADTLVCRWHGYRFDRATGRELAGRRLRLPRVPRIVRDAASGRVKAQLDAGPRAGGDLA